MYYNYITYVIVWGISHHTAPVWFKAVVRRIDSLVSKQAVKVMLIKIIFRRLLTNTHTHKGGVAVNNGQNKGNHYNIEIANKDYIKLIKISSNYYN